VVMALFGGGVTKVPVFARAATMRGGMAGGDVTEGTFASLCEGRFPLLLLLHDVSAPTTFLWVDEGRLDPDEFNVRSSDDLAAHDRGGRAGTLLELGVMLPAAAFRT
jgi:hypothetical protein